MAKATVEVAEQLTNVSVFTPGSPAYGPKSAQRPRVQPDREVNDRKCKGLLAQASSGGARGYARMHFVSAVMHGIDGFGLEPLSPFGVAGLLVSLVPLIDLCRCDFGCRLRRAKGRREWSYHIMVGP